MLTLYYVIFMNRLIFVIGGTGTGKTDIGIAIAKTIKAGAEVISADSMQVYKELSIGTAKVTLSECDGIKHHLIDICDPNSECFNMTQFVTTARHIIENLWSKNIVPVIVGGTILYSSVLLLNLMGYKMPSMTSVGKYSEILVSNVGDRQKKVDQIYNSLSLDLSLSERRFKVLESIDGGRASMLRSNDIFRVEKSINDWVSSGLPHNERAQIEFDPNLALMMSEDLPNSTLFVWVDTESDILQRRLDERVEKMVRTGLINEIRWISDTIRENKRGNRLEGPLETGFGAMQSIGYREFSPLIKIWSHLDECPTDENMPDDDRFILLQCIDELKRKSRAYARKQRTQIVSWIINEDKFFGIPLIKASSSNLSVWPEIKFQVSQVVSEFCKSEIKEKSLSLVSVTSCGEEKNLRTSSNSVLNSFSKHQEFFCSKCGTTHKGKQEWDAHLHSKLHKKGGGRHKKENAFPNKDTIVF